MEPFESSMLKANWADQSFHVLYDEVSSVLNSQLERFLEELNTDKTTQSFRIEIEKNIWSTWSLRLGNILSDLRSSLDYLAFQSAGRRSYCGRCRRYIYFPIKNPEPRNGLATALSCHFKPEIIEVMELFQPYNSSNTKFFAPGDGGVINSTEHRCHYLWFLNKAANIDKHRFLTVTLLEAGVIATNLPDRGIIEATFEDDRIVAELSITDILDPNQHLKPEFSLNPHIEIVDSRTRFHYHLWTIHNVYELIRDEIIPAFSSVLPDAGNPF